MSDTNGLFLVFEGVDGAGKTTQIELLQKRFLSEGIEPLLVREPGGTLIGEAIRDILLSHHSEGMDPRTEMLLFCSSRAELVANKILPSLTSGGVVIADRYRLSTEIYQGVGRGLPIGEVKRTLDFATQNLHPDFTFILDLPYDTAIDRKRLSGIATDRMEAAGEGFFRKVQQAFVQSNGKGYLHLTADSDAGSIHSAIWETIVRSEWWSQRAVASTVTGT